MNARTWFVAVGIAGASLIAHPVAASTIYTDIFDPTDQLFAPGGGACIGNASTDTITGQNPGVGTCNTLTYSHMLLGYNSPPDSLTLATLTLYFYDDNDPTGQTPPNPNETYSLTIDLTSLLDFTTNLNGSSSGSLEDFSFDVSAFISASGVLSSIKIDHTGGDFFFAKSELHAEWTTGGVEQLLVAEVPEPATLVLLGTGLAAVGAWRRRRT